MNVYLASRTDNAGALRGLRTRLRARGHEVTSRWLDLDDGTLRRPTGEALPRDEAAFHARRDLEDIYRADVIVVYLAGWNGARGGMHFEAGYALALGKKGAAVGECPTVFYALPGFTPLRTLDAVLDWLDELESQQAS